MLAALRQGTLSPEFTRAWHAAMRAQAAREFDPGMYRDAHLRLMAAYPNVAHAVRDATSSYLGE